MARARATRAATSLLPSAGGGRIRSAAVTAGTSMLRSMRSSSGPDSRVWYSAAQRVFGPRRQVKPGSLARPQRHGFIAATSMKRAG